MSTCPKLLVWKLFLFMRRRKRPYTEEEKKYLDKRLVKRISVFGHGNLIKELELSSPLDYKSYLLMCTSTFDELLGLITPLAQTEGTNMK
jgi:hypothetical protein